MGWGGGGRLYGEAPPEVSTRFLQASGIYERVGMSLVEEYERVEKSVILVFTMT